MKRAVSISIGSSKRDKTVEIELLGETVRIERIGTDGDMEKAAQLYKELDGQVDAFGVGGADLGMLVDNKWYPLQSVQSLIRFIQKTPVVDGSGIKNTLENRVVPFMDARLGDYIRQQGRSAFVATGADRWGLGQSFRQGGYDVTYGDLMFNLGIPIPLRSERSIKILAALLIPIVGRLPFKWVYPTGKEQEKHFPNSPLKKYYQRAVVTAGDCHYLKRYLPEHMDGKIIVTNTTTRDDVEFFRRAGVKYLVTTTPVIEGRSFGTNMIEAALIAVAGKGRALTTAELNTLLDQLHFEPQLQCLTD